MAVAARLKAAPDPVFVDLDAGPPAGTTKIEYWKNPHDRIWHRDRQGPWRPVQVQVTSPSDPAHTHGTFTSPSLQPGRIYEVSVWERHQDPNHLTVEPPAQPLAKAAIFVLRQRPEQRDFFDGEDWVIGGTRTRHFLSTSRRVNAYEAVGRRSPVQAASGWVSLPEVMRTAWKPLNDSFVLEIWNLLPGNEYHSLTRLSDQNGNWQFLRPKRFTTKLRHIQLSVTDIFVHDDSNDLSGGEGFMNFLVQTGQPGPIPPQQWKTRGRLRYEGNYSSGDHVQPPAGVITVGPEAVTPEMNEIRVVLRVWDDDDSEFLLSEQSDEARGVQMLRRAVEPSEDVVDLVDVVVAGPGDDGLHVSAEFKYSVKYF